MLLPYPTPPPIWSQGIGVIILTNLATSVMAGVGIYIFLRRQRRRKKSPKVANWKEDAFTCWAAGEILALFGMAVDWLTGPGLIYLNMVESRVHLEQKHNVLAILVLILGFGAWVFKDASPGWYGLVEVVFAFVSALAVGRDMTDKREYFAHGATLGGCIYIVSRGLGNIVIGMKKYEEKEKEKARTSTASLGSSTSPPPRLEQ
jgi:hypothetical protein